MRLLSRPRRVPKHRAHARRSRSGIALIIVLVTVSILTSIAVDFSYNSRVNLETAAASRDALRARSLAMSAMNFSRLLLRFQRQIDGAGAAAAGGLGNLLGQLPMGDTSQLGDLAKGLGVNIPPQLLAGGPGALESLLGGAGGGAGGAAGGLGGGLALRLWDVVPIDSNAVTTFAAAAFPDPDSEAVRNRQLDPKVPRTGETTDDDATVIDASFGEFSGSFGAKITDEDQKINLQRLHYSLGGGPLATLVQLNAMWNDQRFDFIFDEEDTNRDMVDRKDMITAFKDWIDDDEQGSSIDLSNMMNPFVAGYGDENGPYFRYKPRYKAKNAKFDTIDELRQVYGVDDAFMAAFGDRLTVYPDVNSKLNINTDDPLQLMINIMTAAANPNDPAIADPLRIQLILEQIKLLKRFPAIGLSVGTFAKIIEGAGIKVKPEITANSAQNVFLGDKSSTFRVVATGTAGRVTKTLTAIVRYDEGLGQILYWNEE